MESANVEQGSFSLNMQSYLHNIQSIGQEVERGGMVGSTVLDNSGPDQMSCPLKLRLDWELRASRIFLL